jgi:tetratricopeptide (TPR) repeat protein
MGPGLRRGDLSRVLRYNRRAMNNSLRLCLMLRMRYVTIALILCAAVSRVAFAAATEPATDPQVDPAPCAAAAAAGDDDKVMAVCGALVDSEKTLASDRIKALIARASAFARKDQIDRAISDYDTALRLDPTLADIFNTRGELWRKEGDLPHALADFGAAIKLNPQHEAARANYKSLALELERIGAQMAIKDKPNPKSSPPLKPGQPLK